METIETGRWREQEAAETGGRVTVWELRVPRVPLLLVNVVGITALLLGMLGVDVWFGPWLIWMGLLGINGGYVAGRLWDAARQIPVGDVVTRRVYRRQTRRETR